MRIVNISQLDEPARVRALSAVAQEIKKGALVAFPTDTVYGLLADATNPHAVDKLIACKARPPGKPISIFVRSFDMLKQYVEISETMLARVSRILPGPYTVILPSKHRVDVRLESERKTLGVRMISYDPVNELLAQLDVPVTATSANQSTRPPHYSVPSLLGSLPAASKEMIDIVVDGGMLPYNLPSTVVDYTGDDVVVIRPGDRGQLVNVGHYETHSEHETVRLANEVAKRYESMTSRPLAYLLRGDLGSGKTVVSKALASAYGIESVVSPTYVVYYEYEIPGRDQKTYFVHADLYNIQEDAEFEHLGMAQYLKPHNVLCIEWSEKLGSFFPLIRQNAIIVYIDIQHVDENTRIIDIYTPAK